MWVAWGGCWFVDYIRRFIYKFLNVCPFDYTTVAGSGKVEPVNQVYDTSWMVVVTPTDRPKSDRNRCVIELFCGVVCVVILPFWNFCWCRGFCHRTESDLFLFLLTYINNTYVFCLINNKMIRAWRSNVQYSSTGYIKLSSIQYFVSADKTQLVEHWIDDLEIADSSPLYATIFVRTMFACWHTSYWRIPTMSMTDT